VEDRDEKTGTDPEIEAHRRKKVLKANEEPTPEDSAKDEDEKDVELHTTTTRTTTTTT
jgi:hypothetical protein